MSPFALRLLEADLAPTLDRHPSTLGVLRPVAAMTMFKQRGGPSCRIFKLMIDGP